MNFGSCTKFQKTFETNFFEDLFVSKYQLTYYIDGIFLFVLFIFVLSGLNLVDNSGKRLLYHAHSLEIESRKSSQPVSFCPILTDFLFPVWSYLVEIKKNFGSSFKTTSKYSKVLFTICLQLVITCCLENVTQHFNMQWIVTSEYAMPVIFLWWSRIVGRAGKKLLSDA